MPKTSHPLDWLILALLVVAWGSSFAMTKIAVAHLDAAWIMALRLSIAALILVPYAWSCGETLRAPTKTWRKFSLLALIGHAAPFFLITWGTQFVASGVSGLLMGAIPLFLVVLAHFFLPGEPLTLPKSAGFLLGFAGIVVLIGPEALFTLSLSGEELMGEAAILLACLCYAVHGIAAKRMGIEDPVKQTASVCLAAALMGLVFAGATNPSGLHGVAPVAVWSVIGLGVLPTAIATLLMYHLIHRTGPSFVAYSNYLVPVYAVLLGALLLGEALNWNVALALALILLGIAVSRWQSAAKPETA
ncbi:MAG: DMT family transporter [Alphaproteobacteria bacterium]|nr:DMT family transporter [Alphaproteobacteria bacterium]